MTAATLAHANQAHINQTNASHSTGPKTPAGKQRASMNAFRHGLTGNRMILQPHEQEAYQRLTETLTSELQPVTAMESQLVGKIIDCHTRINRIAAIETNILNFGLLENTSDAPHDDALECMAAQSRAWLAHENSFEKLGRYEARLARQLLGYTKELERLQNSRCSDSARVESAQPIQTAPLNSQLASFRSAPVTTPRSAACPCGSGVKYKRCCGRDALPVLGRAA